MDRLRAARFCACRRDLVAIVSLATSFCVETRWKTTVIRGITSVSFSYSRTWSNLLPNPATIDRALARPTLKVVFGSLRGGTGAGDLPSVPPITTLLLPLRGKVAYCRWMG